MQSVTLEATSPSTSTAARGVGTVARVVAKPAALVAVGAAAELLRPSPTVVGTTTVAPAEGISTIGIPMDQPMWLAAGALRWAGKDMLAKRASVTKSVGMGVGVFRPDVGVLF